MLLEDNHKSNYQKKKSERVSKLQELLNKNDHLRQKLNKNSSHTIFDILEPNQ